MFLQEHMLCTIQWLNKCSHEISPVWDETLIGFIIYRPSVVVPVGGVGWMESVYYHYCNLFLFY